MKAKRVTRDAKAAAERKEETLSLLRVIETMTEAVSSPLDPSPLKKEDQQCHLAMHSLFERTMSARGRERLLPPSLSLPPLV